MPPASSRASGSLVRLVRALHRAIRDTDGTSSLMERFDELTKVLYCKVCDERGGSHGERGAREGDGALAFAADGALSDAERAIAIRRSFARVTAERAPLFPERFATLRLSDTALARLAALLAPVTLSGREEDLKGLAYEELIRDAFDKGDNQQFFTPRPIVDFMVAMVDDRLSGTVCDPACGTGGFLLGVARWARERGLPSPPRLIGYEIDERLAWAARMNLDMHDIANAEVAFVPGAGALGEAIAPRLGTVDVVITNPPFGSDLSHADALEAFELGRGRPSRRRGVLFLERCLELVRPGGLVAIIIDDAVLNAPSTADARRHVLHRAHPLAVVSLPETAFMPYATVRSSVVLLERTGGGAAREPTFFAEAEVVGRRSNGEPLLRVEPDTRRLVPDSDLPGILAAWRGGAASASASRVPRAFRAMVPDAADPAFARAGHRLDPAFHHPARHGAAAALADARHPRRALRALVSERSDARVPAREMPDDDLTYIGLADIAPGTGACTPQVVRGASLRSAVKRCLPGDILFARMRPALRKVALLSADVREAWTSSECLVLTPRPAGEEPSMLPELLALLLRSDLAYGQIVHLVIGIGRPRVSRAAVMALELPVPPLPEQRALLEQYAEGAREARSLLAAAERARAAADGRIDRATEELVGALLGRELGGSRDEGR